MSLASATPAATAAGAAPGKGGYRRRWRYMLFALPAMIVILAVILFPWAFTLYLSVHDWPVVGDPSFVGLGNYLQLFSDSRFIESI